MSVDRMPSLGGDLNPNKRPQLSGAEPFLGAEKSVFHRLTTLEQEIMADKPNKKLVAQSQFALSRVHPSFLATLALPKLKERLIESGVGGIEEYEAKIKFAETVAYLALCTTDQEFRDTSKGILDNTYKQLDENRGNSLPSELRVFMGALRKNSELITQIPRYARVNPMSMRQLQVSRGYKTFGIDKPVEDILVEIADRLPMKN